MVYEINVIYTWERGLFKQFMQVLIDWLRDNGKDIDMDFMEIDYSKKYDGNVDVKNKKLRKIVKPFKKVKNISYSQVYEKINNNFKIYLEADLLKIYYSLFEYKVLFTFYTKNKEVKRVFSMNRLSKEDRALLKTLNRFFVLSTYIRDVSIEEAERNLRGDILEEVNDIKVFKHEKIKD